MFTQPDGPRRGRRRSSTSDGYGNSTCRIARAPAERTARNALLAIATLPAIGGCPQPPDSADRMLAAQPIASGLVAPVALAAPRDGAGRLLVVDQIGVVRVVAGGALLDEPFLDIRDRLVELSASYDERGLLSMALHPEFEANRRFFVCYNAPLGDDDPPGFDSQLRISEFRAADALDRADADSERILLQIPKPQANHNGGQLAFGPDGMLYVGVGDGGGANDTGHGHTAGLGNAQDVASLLGKILRIDVDGAAPYEIPPGNPFAGQKGVRPEIFALGLRNPWRFSFDGERLFAADVGQNRFEEVDRIVAGGNYGWNLREGLHCFDPSNPLRSPGECMQRDARGERLLPPIIEYPHAGEGISGQAIVGGFVYRGAAIPELRGRYVFANWSASFLVGAGKLLVASEDEAGAWSAAEVALADTAGAPPGGYILAFGEDSEGELYVLSSQRLGPAGRTGAVHKLTPAE